MMSRRPTIAFSLATLLALGVAAGCAPSTVADNYGKSRAEVMERQIQNPESSSTRNPVDGLGPTTAADVVRNYHENQKTESQERRQERQRDNGLVELDN